MTRGLLSGDAAEHVADRHPGATGIALTEDIPGHDLARRPDVLGGFAVAISIVLAIWLAKAQNKLLGVSLGLVIGGALGNAIDRAIYHAVADFLDFHAAGYHWPSFNVADIAITVGVILLLLDGLITRRDDNKLQS